MELSGDLGGKAEEEEQHHERRVVGSHLPCAHDIRPLQTPPHQSTNPGLPAFSLTNPGRDSFTSTLQTIPPSFQSLFRKTRTVAMQVTVGRRSQHS